MNNKLELPMDIGEKVLAMLQPKTRPACVLVFTGLPTKKIYFKTGTLDDTDRDYIMQGLDHYIGGEDPQYMGVSQPDPDQ
jgi:hypothetical protein